MAVRPKSISTNDSASTIMKWYDAAVSRKTESNNLREDAGKYAWPTARDMYRAPENSDGQEYALDVFDSTAINASFRLASNIFSYLMPVGTTWFEFEASDYEDNQNPQIAEWLSKASRITHKEIWRSNFIREMLAAVRSMVVFGTGVLSVERVDKELVYRAYHVGDIAFQENSKGVIDTVFRNVSYTARQAVQEFGEDNLPDKIKEAADKPSQANERFKFIHAVFPAKDFDSRKITSKKFRSTYIYVNDKKIVKEDGFNSNPYFIMRFAIAPGELWGRGPVIEMLPDIRQLNQMQFDFTEASELALHPPMIVDDDGVIGQPVTEPRGIIYKRVGSDDPRPWNTGGNLPITREVLEDKRNVIREGMLLNAFQTLEGTKNISSATESEIRRQEGLVVIAPVVGSVQKEGLDPIIARSLELVPESKLPPAPKEFDFDVVYQGRLAMAMSGIQASAIEINLAAWAPYGELGVFDNIDIDKAYRITALAKSVPAEVLVPVEQVAAKRKEEKDKIDAAQAAQTGETASKALKNLSGPVDPNSALAQV